MCAGRGRETRWKLNCRGVNFFHVLQSFYVIGFATELRMSRLSDMSGQSVAKRNREVTDCLL